MFGLTEYATKAHLDKVDFNTYYFSCKDYPEFSKELGSVKSYVQLPEFYRDSLEYATKLNSLYPEEVEPPDTSYTPKLTYRYNNAYLENFISALNKIGKSEYYHKLNSFTLIKVLDQLTPEEELAIYNANKRNGILVWNRFAWVDSYPVFYTRVTPTELSRKIVFEQGSFEHRYCVSCYISFVNACISEMHGCENIRIKMLYILLFSEPHRSDFATCSFSELLLDLGGTLDNLVKYKNLGFDKSKAVLDVEQYVKHYFIDSRLKNIYFSFLKHNSSIYYDRYLFFIDMYRYLVNLKRSIKIYTPTIEKTFIECTNDLPKKIIKYSKKSNINLPETIYAYEVNKLSNGYIPMFFGQDSYGLFAFFVPTKTKVWNALFSIYNIPKHISLYPENTNNKILLNPESKYFMDIMQKIDFYFIETINVCSYLNLEDTNNSDYMFYCFYLFK